MIARLLQQRLLASPERVALLDGTRSVTAGELDRLARGWAKALAEHRRVGLLADNGVALVGAFLGAWYAGLAVVPFHADTPDDEVQRRLRRFGVDLLLDGAALAVSPVAARWSGLADEAEPALLLGTSGTTGEPRAVVIGRDGLAAHALALVEMLGLGPGDRVLGALPLAHSYGCRMGLLVPLLAGATVVLARRFSARATLELVERQGVTWAPLVPTMLSAWCAVPGPPPATLGWVLSAGAPLTESLRVRAEARLGCAVRQGYGLTEASFSTVDAPPRAPTPGTVGRPVPGVEVRLTAASGEVEVRGPHLMAGYLDEPAATAAAFTADGWLRTGDVGVLSGDTLSIVDRLKDIILRGGHTIYPAEVEAVLARHPAVQAVAVVGRPHPHLGEEVVAHLVLTSGDANEARLTEWSVARLAPHQVPAAFVAHTELPLGPSGKVLKRRLR